MSWFHELIRAHACVYLSSYHVWLGIAAAGKLLHGLTHAQSHPPHLPHNGLGTVATHPSSVPKVLSFQQHGKHGIVWHMAIGRLAFPLCGSSRSAQFVPVSVCGLFLLLSRTP